MENETKYTLEEIEAAWKRVYPDNLSTHGLNKMRIELTRPKHNFRGGEVIYKHKGSPICYFRYEQGWEWDSNNFRPLRLSEMPQAVEDLREAMVKIAESGDEDSYHIENLAADALAKFDAEIRK